MVVSMCVTLQRSAREVSAYACWGTTQISCQLLICQPYSTSICTVLGIMDSVGERAVLALVLFLPSTSQPVSASTTLVVPSRHFGRRCCKVASLSFQVNWRKTTKGHKKWPCLGATSFGLDCHFWWVFVSWFLWNMLTRRCWLTILVPDPNSAHTPL